ncbi:hypothetical protein AAFF_G00320140 [Aldrovandia affinis]|uniref:Uncharacterized protein n=1 Tax=Aldrovandia affinis TaxID=143900 RepID=A0AAD7W0F0_9TELE|nr:hypothetical protein AAFF_G00320140 [Aldrovandia affinis]
MKWLADLNQLSTFQVPHCMKPEDFGEIKTAQLHHFSDASELGYGTASYIRMTNDKDEIHTALVMGKARVTPLKQVTIPRLELAAATLSVRIDRMLKTELQIQMEDSVFWTDSQSVLKYINNETKRFQTFVANRISVIRDLSSPSQWRYVSSKQNPVDDASRDMNVEVFLSSRRWLKGPDYLLEPEKWPTTPKEVNYLSSSDAEVRKELSINSVSVDERKPMTRFIEHFSKWNSLKRAVAWMLKLKETVRQLSKMRHKISKQTDLVKEHMDAFKQTLGPQRLSVEDLEEAERDVICYVQEQHFKQ